MLAAAVRTGSVLICLASVLLLVTPCAGAETTRREQSASLYDLVMQTRQARLSGDSKGWLEYGQRVLERAPDHPDLLISVGRALAANGRLDDALGRLEEAVRRGAGFDLSTFPELKSAPDDARTRALRERALKNMTPVAPSEVFLTIQDESLDPEGITWDPIGSRLYIGSLRGEIWRVDLDAKLQRFAGPDSGLREVLGLKVDAKRRLLWAVTGVFPDLFAAPGEPKKDVGVTGLHAYLLDSGKRVRACTLDERPVLHGFNDMALASNGDVYVTDTSTNAIYRLSGNGCQFDRILHDSALSFPNGIVLTPNESRLYVAHVEGISAVEVRTGKRTLLPVPMDGAVNSIDGLAWDGKEVLGIQASPYLLRVARIRLADDGLSIQAVSTVSSRPPLGLNPTTGVVVNGHFYSVAGFPDAIAAQAGQPQPLSRILRARLR